MRLGCVWNFCITFWFAILDWLSLIFDRYNLAVLHNKFLQNTRFKLTLKQTLSKPKPRLIVVDAWPWSTRAKKDCRRRLGPLFDHPSWWRSRAREACWRPFSWMVLHVMRVCGVWHGSRGASGALFSVEEGRSTFGGMTGIWAKFKGFPKVNGVTTNHWGFLRCNWLPVSSWFYYQS